MSAKIGRPKKSEEPMKVINTENLQKEIQAKMEIQARMQKRSLSIEKDKIDRRKKELFIGVLKELMDPDDLADLDLIKVGRENVIDFRKTPKIRFDEIPEVVRVKFLNKDLFLNELAIQYLELRWHDDARKWKIKKLYDHEYQKVQKLLKSFLEKQYSANLADQLGVK